jgi:hypothetical protein
MRQGLDISIISQIKETTSIVILEWFLFKDTESETQNEDSHTSSQHKTQYMDADSFQPK